MMNRLFGRGEDLEGAVMALSERVDMQNKNIISVNTNVVEMGGVVERLRDYLEVMEVRQYKQFESLLDVHVKEVDKAVTGVIEAVKSEIQALPNATEVVKAIDTRSKEERKLRNFRVAKSKLDPVTAKYLVNDLPLVTTRKDVKTPQLTPQGQIVYNAISKFIVDVAKVSGKNKESFTSSRMYSRFFKQFGIKRYEREDVLKTDGKNMRTLLATIMLKGHIVQYVNFLMGVLEKEKESAKE